MYIHGYTNPKDIIFDLAKIFCTSNNLTKKDYPNNWKLVYPNIFEDGVDTYPEFWNASSPNYVSKLSDSDAKDAMDKFIAKFSKPASRDEEEEMAYRVYKKITRTLPRRIVLKCMGHQEKMWFKKQTLDLRSEDSTRPHPDNPEAVIVKLPQGAALAEDGNIRVMMEGKKYSLYRVDDAMDVKVIEFYIESGSTDLVLPKSVEGTVVLLDFEKDIIDDMLFTPYYLEFKQSIKVQLDEDESLNEESDTAADNFFYITWKQGDKYNESAHAFPEYTGTYLSTNFDDWKNNEDYNVGDKVVIVTRRYFKCKLNYGTGIPLTEYADRRPLSSVPSKWNTYWTEISSSGLTDIAEWQDGVSYNLDEIISVKASTARYFVCKEPYTPMDYEKFKPLSTISNIWQAYWQEVSTTSSGFDEDDYDDWEDDKNYVSSPTPDRVKIDTSSGTRYFKCVKPYTVNYSDRRPTSANAIIWRTYWDEVFEYVEEPAWSQYEMYVETKWSWYKCNPQTVAYVQEWLPIEYWMNIDGTSCVAVIMGDPGMSATDYLSSPAYFGQLEQIEGALETDDKGNFATFSGSDQNPQIRNEKADDRSRGVGGTLLVPNIDRLKYYGDYTGTGTTDIIMTSSKSGRPFQGHKVGLFGMYEFKEQTFNGQSSHTNKHSVTDIVVADVHENERGILKHCLGVPKLGKEHGVELVADRYMSGKETTYIFLHINSLYTPFNTGNDVLIGIAIQTSDDYPKLRDKN